MHVVEFIHPHQVFIKHEHDIREQSGLFAEGSIEEKLEDHAAEFFEIVSVLDQLLGVDRANLIREFEQTSAKDTSMLCHF